MSVVCDMCEEDKGWWWKGGGVRGGDGDGGACGRLERLAH